MERGATAVKRWSDVDAATLQRTVKGDPLSPRNRNSRRQGTTHELCRRPCKSEIAKLLNTTSSLDRGPLTTPKSLPACRATAAPPKQLSPPNNCRLRNNCPLRKQWGQHCHSCAPGITRAPAQQTQLVRGPLPPRRRSSLPVDRATAAPPKQASFPKRQSPPKRGDQSQRTRCAHSHGSRWFYPVFTPVLPPFYHTCVG